MSNATNNPSFHERLYRAIEAEGITRGIARSNIKHCQLGRKEEQVFDSLEQWVKAYARRRVLEETGKDLTKGLDDE